MADVSTQGSGAIGGRKMLGEIFVEKRILTPALVERGLALSRRLQKRFGTVMEDLGFVTGDELAQALALQYGLQYAKEFAKFTFPAELLQMVPIQTAVEHSVFPLKATGDTLALAMIDPTIDKVVAGIETSTKLRVVRVVATRLEISRAVCRHYLGREYAGQNTGKSILIVDDDKLIRTSLSVMLANKGYRVTTAENGLVAFNEVVAVRPDVVITDKEMPKRDGYQLLESLKRIPDMQDTPVLLITSSTSPEDEAMAYDRGFFDFISKPFFSIVVEAKVRRALKAKNPVASL